MAFHNDLSWEQIVEHVESCLADSKSTFHVVDSHFDKSGRQQSSFQDYSSSDNKIEFSLMWFCDQGNSFGSESMRTAYESYCYHVTVYD